MREQGHDGFRELALLVGRQRLAQRAERAAAAIFEGDAIRHWELAPGEVQRTPVRGVKG